MIQVYQLLHLLGLVLFFTSVGQLTARAWAGGEVKVPARSVFIHAGVGLFLILLGGFGLLARLYDNHWFGWVIVKLCVWMALTVIVVLFWRAPKLGRLWGWLAILLSLVSFVMVYLRPL